MRVSQALADRIARQLVSKAKEAYDKREVALADYLIGLINDNTPTEVKDLHDKYPSYITTSDRIYYGSVPGIGGYRAITSSNTFIMKFTSNGRGHGMNTITDYVKLTDAQIDHIYTESRGLDQDSRDIRSSETKIAAAIKGLGTFARVRANFPEAAKYLPGETVSNGVKVGEEICNIADIRKLVQDINPVEIADTEFESETTEEN